MKHYKVSKISTLSRWPTVTYKTTKTDLPQGPLVAPLRLSITSHNLSLAHCHWIVDVQISFILEHYNDFLSTTTSILVWVASTQFVLLKSPIKCIFKKSTAISLSRNHDPATQDNPQPLFWAVSCRNYFLSTELHRITGQKEACIYSWKSRYTLPSVQWCLKKMLPTCSQRGLWINLSNWVMVSGKRHFLLSLSNILLWHFEHHTTSTIRFHCVGGKADISKTDTSKTT